MTTTPSPVGLGPTTWIIIVAVLLVLAAAIVLYIS
jgi:hypothetical protein